MKSGYVRLSRITSGDSRNPAQRLDALLRSTLYAHFSESLNGVSTIRAYGETARFCAENAARIDTENRCVARFCRTRPGLIVALKCLLDVGCNSTVAQRSVGFPRSFVTFCSRYPGCRCQVLHLRCTDRGHHCVHLHCSASVRLDDQVSGEGLTRCAIRH